METRLVEVRDFEQLSQAMRTAENIITKEYLYDLENYKVLEIPDEWKKLDISGCMRLYRLKRIVSDNKENMLDKLVTVINAAYTSEASIIMLIKGYEQYTEYYLGIVDKKPEIHDIGTLGEIYKGVLKGNFPGIELENIDKSGIEWLNQCVFDCEYLTSISGIASIRNEKDRRMEKYVQGIEHLIDSIQGREYSIVVIADPVRINEIAITKKGYEKLYTQLSPFLRTTLSYSETDNITLTQSHTEGVTKSIGESMSLTQNYSSITY